MKFSKFLRTPFFTEVFQWQLLALTRVFKGVQSKSRCDCQQQISNSAKKSICRRENPEAATAGVLQNKTIDAFLWMLRNFEEHLFWKTSVNGCSWKSVPQWQIYWREKIPELYYPFKEVWYNCSAHRSAHLFINEISSHIHGSSHGSSQRRIFLQYSCSVSTINIFKKYLSGKIHELNNLVGSSDGS